MKVVVFGPQRRLGALAGDQVIDLSYAAAKYLLDKNGASAAESATSLVPNDLGTFIERGSSSLDAAQAALEYILARPGDDGGVNGERIVQPASEVKLHRPQASSAARIACAGGNFAKHLVGMRPHGGGDVPTYQEAVEGIRRNGFWGFWKIVRAVVGPDEDVIYPSRTERLDYEGEAAVIIGKPAKDVMAANASDYFWGVTLHVDWSIRDKRDPAMPLNFAMSKNFDTSSSLGPCIVVGEVDPHDVTIETRVNGELRQQYNTSEMVFSFEEYLEYLSRDFTLFSGDIISGGTGSGTAMDSSPRDAKGVSAPDRFVKVGDVVEVSSPQIGTLRNRIFAKSAP